MVIGFTDEGSSFQYTQNRAEDVEKRLIPLLKSEDSPYKKFLMIVPGFGSDNSFIIIALLDHWKNRKQNSQMVMRQAIGKIVTVPQTLAFPISPQSIRVSNYNKPVQMVIYGNTYEELEELQSKVIGMLYKNRNLHHILECAKKINKKNYLEIFKMVIEIEKIKQKVVKKFNNNKQLSKIEFNEMMEQITHGEIMEMNQLFL